MTLKEKTLSGIKWQVFNKIAQKVISVATFAVLARVLEPTVFGLFAAAFIAIDALQFFKSFGLDSALIHRKNETVEEAIRSANTAFYIIQSWGVLLFLVAVLAAPLAGHFFKDPKLIPIIQALGIIFIFTCFSKVPTTLLQKNLKFKEIMAMDFAGSIVNSAFAIVLAIITRNVWGLVFAYILKQITITALSWYFSGFKLKWTFDRKIAKELFGYGKFMIGLNLLWFFGHHMNDLVVGRMLGVTVLGYLVLAENIGNFINTHFTALIANVMFPAYSSIQHDKSAVKRAYLKTIKFVTLVSAPFSVFLICLADEFVHILYGEKWLAIVPLIQMFGITQLMIPITWCSGPIFLGCGKPKYTFYMALAGIIVRFPVLVYFTSLWGMQGAVLSMVLIVALFTPINIHYVKKLVSFKYSEFFKALWVSYISAFALYFVITLLRMLVDSTLNIDQFAWHYVAEFFLFGLTGALLYAAVVFVMDRDALMEIKGLIIRKTSVPPAKLA